MPAAVYIDGILQDFTVESWNVAVKGEGQPVCLTVPSASLEIELTEEQLRRLTKVLGAAENPKCRCCGK